MNKLYHIALASVLSFSMVSCSDRLDIDQHGVIDESAYYKNDEEAASAIAAAYVKLSAFESPYKVVNGYLGDEFWSGQQDHDNKYSFLTSYDFDSENSEISEYFTSLYNIIGECNQVIDNVKGNTPFQCQALAEARTLRAASYFELTTMWGNPPLREHAGTDQPGNSDPATLWAFIENDLKMAIESGALSQKSSLQDRTAAYRVTKQYAQALLGKAYLWQNKKNEAAKVLDEVINSGLYDLFTGEYGDFYDTPNENNPEVIFASNRIKDKNNLASATFFPMMSNLSLYTRPSILQSTNTFNLPLFTFGGYSPRSDLYNAFVAEEGTDGYRMNQTVKTYEYMAANGYPITSTGFENGEGYFLWKGRYTASQIELQSIVYLSDRDCCWMRYAEVLLMAAEANVGIDQSKADTYLNKVRSRARLQDKTCDMEAIKTERRLELVGDFCRYKDLQRWGDAATVLKDVGKVEPTFTAQGVTWENRKESYGYKTGKNEYLPYPNQEILINPNIKQNPGWE